FNFKNFLIFKEIIRKEYYLIDLNLSKNFWIVFLFFSEVIK
ncbi:hypothetical protein Mgra_00001223, partial [Meloidogyne graminicola]